MLQCEILETIIHFIFRENGDDNIHVSSCLVSPDLAIRPTEVSRERDNISNTGYASQVPQEAIEPESEASVRRGTPSTEVGVPLEMA